MIDEEIKIIKNNDCIIFLSEHDKNLLEGLQEKYKNIIVLDESMQNINIKYIDAINNSKKLKKVIFVNFIMPFAKMYENIKNKTIENIFTYDISSFTDQYIMIIFNNIMDYYDRNIIKKIYCLDSGSFEVLKKANYNVEKINLIKTEDVKINNKEKNSIGILCTDYDPKHNFYNALTSIRLVNNYSKVKLISHMNATIDFFNYFDINYELCENIDDVMKNNFVNLYCCFSNHDISLIFKSMNMGVPCIIGNCDVFDDNKILKELLVLKSDDDVNEIADKVNRIKDNYEKIFEEYREWRKIYEK